MNKRIAIVSIVLLLVAGVACQAKTGISTSKYNPYFNKGYVGNVGIGSEVYFNSDAGYEVSTSHGYSYGQGTFIGGGAKYANGFEPNSSGAFSGFLEARHSFLDRIVSPFVDCRIGVRVSEFGYLGTVVSGGIGVDICRFSMGISYMHGGGYEYSAKGYVFSNGFRFSVAYAF